VIAAKSISAPHAALRYLRDETREIARVGVDRVAGEPALEEGVVKERIDRDSPVYREIKRLEKTYE